MSVIRPSGRRAGRFVVLLATMSASVTLAGVADSSAGAATSGPAEGTIVISDLYNERVIEVPPGGGGQTTITAPNSFGDVQGVAVDDAGNVFIADAGQPGGVYEVPADGGSQIQVGSGLTRPSSVAVDHAGDLFVVMDPNYSDGLGSVVEVPAGGGAQTTLASGLDNPSGIAVDALGDVFFTQTSSTTSAIVELTAGGGKHVIVSSTDYFNGVATDGAGDLYYLDYSSSGSAYSVMERPAGSNASVLVHDLVDPPFALAVDAAGDLFVGERAEGKDGHVIEFPAGGGASTMVDIGTGPSLTVLAGVAVMTAAPIFTAGHATAHATAGRRYSYTYRAATPAGQPTARFRVASGALPLGLHLNETSGTLSGTPTRAGSYRFVVETYNAAKGTVAPRTTIAVTHRPVAVTVRLAHSPAVFGQKNRVTATAVAAGGHRASGTVQFLVDGRERGTPMRLVKGSATSALGTLPVGAHSVTARFAPSDKTVDATGSGVGTLTVHRAATRITVGVSGSALIAKVIALAPGAGTPTGTVVFRIGGHKVGHAVLHGGTARLHHRVPAGKAHWCTIRVVAAIDGVRR